METENNSASQSGVQKPSSTPEMSSHDAEDMVNSMLRDSPLPNLERGNDEIPEGDGNRKLPEGGEGKKLLEGNTNEQPKKTPAGKLVTPCRKGIILLLLMRLSSMYFL